MTEEDFRNWQAMCADRVAAYRELVAWDRAQGRKAKRPRKARRKP